MSRFRGADKSEATAGFTLSSSEEIMVSLAAYDPRLQEVTRCLLTDPDAPEGEQSEDYNEVSVYIAETYGLEPEAVSDAMNLCVATIYEELKDG